jgi:predicted ATPase/class 3 adenylate cyclase
MIHAVRKDLPAGTVTFLFTDVEGSTKLLDELGAQAYARALDQHRRVLRDAFIGHRGVEVDTQGDAFFVAFPTAPGALKAAVQATESLAGGPIRVRMGIHTGTPHLAPEGYVGIDVHRAARIAAAGHGGQVLLSATTAALVGVGGALRDLGEHRLKDLSAPERLYQLGHEEFPPLRTLHQTNLPIPATPFLGRERELGEVVALLSQEDVRLLTLTGVGGTGKTRLGLQAAGELADRYRQGTWWVPLAPVRDPELVLASAGPVVGARDGLAEYIGDRSMLLLFDNFEHVVAAAADLADLLSACPNLDMLVTSREPLHLTGEQEYTVPPLARDESISFFLSRARAVNPAFEPEHTVAEICHRLDDLPLALELAAARVKALSPKQILDRLEQRLPLLTGGARDVPERQRTLRATIDWSHELLSTEERRLFARLAVFRGGCTLEAAEEVAEAELDTLQPLVDKSLLRYGEERYWMLETIREYATEHLEASGEGDDLRRRQAEHVLALAGRAAPHLRRSSTEWLERLEAERDNVRAALSWLLDASRGEDALEILTSLGQFWWVRGPAEGLAWLENALASPGAAPERLAPALEVAGGCAWFTGDPERALELFEEGLSLFREIGDRAGVAMMLTRLGPPLQAVGRADEADAVVRQSLAVHRELGEKRETMLGLHMLGAFASERGDREKARPLLEEAAAICRELGDTFFLEYNLSNLAELELHEGDAARAESLSRESLAVAREIGDEVMMFGSLILLSVATARRGELELAGRLWGAAERRELELGPTLMGGERARFRELLGEPGPIFEQAREAGRAMSPDEAVDLALKR